MLSLDGVVGQDITARAVEDSLAFMSGRNELVVRINSSGGSVQEGVAIHDLIRSMPGLTIVEIRGWALSIASYIAMSADRIRIAHNAVLMLHEPWLPTAGGNATELRQQASMLDALRDSLVHGYRRSGKAVAEIRALMAAETWYDAAAAVAEGFADEIIEDNSTAPAAAAFAIARYRNIDHVKEIAMPGVVASGHVSTPAGAASQADSAAAALAADRQRRADIRAAFARFVNHDGVRELQTSCEDELQCTATQAASRLLAHLGAHATPAAGSYVVGQETLPYAEQGAADIRSRDFREAAAHAVMLRNGVPVAKPSPAARDLAGTSIVELARSCLSMAGRSARSLSPQQVLAAATHSTSDFPLLLQNIAGKSLAIGYAEENAGHTVWTAEREVPDFKKQSIVSLSEAPSLDEVPELAEYKSGTFGESAEQFQVKTYGKVFGISRQALINDDLGGFTRLPQAFGAAARRREADLVYGKLTGSADLSDGNPLFHASHGNLAGSGAALDVTSLGAARAAMRVQKGIGGLAFIDPQPRVLLVPVALETKAEALLSSLNVAVAGGNTQSIEWIKSLTLVADPRLDAVSATAWYLVADARRIEGIVRAYLANEPRPFIEERAEFIQDGYTLKCRLDVGVGVVDYRAFYKNPGA